jgi:hypothetical protein
MSAIDPKYQEGTVEAVDMSAIDPKYQEGTVEAPDDMIWVCSACGKTSRTRYGFNAQNENVCLPGWDASCMSNAVLCYRKRSG